MLHRKLHKKCFLEQKGMTYNHTLRSRESFQPYNSIRLLFYRLERITLIIN